MARSRIKVPSAKSKARLQEKRRAAKLLRQAGILTRKTIPRLTKQSIQGNRTIDRLRKQFADVLLGNARVTKVGKIAARKYKAAGYRIRGDRVIVPVQPNERVYSRAGKIVREVFAGPRTLIEPTGRQRRLPPRPPRGPGAPGGSDFEDCLERLEIWWLANAEYRFGDPEERWEQLAALARQHPRIFLRVINARHYQSQQYLAGIHPANVRIRGWDVFEDFTELHYYHPTSSDSSATGGIIPRC